jgi:hypothetical protein
VADSVGVSAELVYAISVSRRGNLRKQADQSARGRAAKVLVVVLRSEELVAHTLEQSAAFIGPERFDAIVVVLADALLGPSVAASASAPESVLRARLELRFPDANHTVVTPSHQGDGRQVAFVAPTPLVVAAPSNPLVVDARVKRMLRLAIASSRAVMLVGPPGTGKTSLLHEVLADVAADPASFGLRAPPAGALHVTPEEGWTMRELVGGETVDDGGRLRFRAGHVLDAIRSHRWLVLDEANRADMDRIFGGLLTWLSGQPVTLGKASNELDAAEIRLEWGAGPADSVEGYERLMSGTGAPVRFVAGTDWRLLGTYNALDAQRVFRFGQALGRRFTRVPIPAIGPEDFGRALAPYLEALDSEPAAARVAAVLGGLYAAHLETRPVMGPALFLSIPSYVANGLTLLGTAEVIDDAEPDASDATRRASAVETLLAEGYVLGAGPWLAQLEPEELDRLHERIVTEEQLFTEAQWSFVRELLPALA